MTVHSRVLTAAVERLEYRRAQGWMIEGQVSAAIHAADDARAVDVRTAVERLVECAMQYGRNETPAGYNATQAAIRELYLLLNVRGTA